MAHVTSNNALAVLHEIGPTVLFFSRYGGTNIAVCFLNLLSTSNIIMRAYLASAIIIGVDADS